MSASGYLAFARAHPRFLAFGFVMTFASSVGQTYFIGVFGPAVRADFALSHTAWSAIYMAGTLMSAALLPWTGRQIDRLALRSYTVLVCLGLVLAAAVMAAVPSAAWLVLAVFLLRQAGQGLASHVGTTAMARYFEADRGKAVALASLGFSVGEAVLPLRRSPAPRAAAAGPRQPRNPTRPGPRPCPGRPRSSGPWPWCRRGSPGPAPPGAAGRPPAPARRPRARRP